MFPDAEAAMDAKAKKDWAEERRRMRLLAIATGIGAWIVLWQQTGMPLLSLILAVLFMGFGYSGWEKAAVREKILEDR